MNEKRSRNKPLHSVLNNVGYLLSEILREHRFLFVLIVTEALCGILAPILGIYLPKIALELVAQRAGMREILGRLGGFIAGLCVILGLRALSGHTKYFLINNLRFVYMRRLFYKTLDCDYKQIESSEGQTRYQRTLRTLTSGDASGTSRMITSTSVVFISTANFLLYSGIIALLNPTIVVLLIGLSAVNYLALYTARQYEQKQRGEAAVLEKKLNYVERASGDIKAGKDVRLYGMASWFSSVREGMMALYTALQYRVETRRFWASMVNALTLLLRDGAAYAYLIWLVTTGRLTAGDFVLYLGAVTGFSGFVSQLINNVNQLFDANSLMNDMRAFLEQTDEPEPDNPLPAPPAGTPPDIEFRNVSFSYNNVCEPLIRNFNLYIKPGEKIALVGVNGAGKTTLTKLLCGFYQPDSGEILIGGINIRHFLKKDRFALFSAVFQDIMIFPHTVAENVSMRSVAETDRSRVLRCLAHAGLDGEINKYPGGIGSPMTRLFEESGIVLSGGQQQKLLLARALYKDAPVLILDEPTAALDPIAESEVYENFHALSRDKTAIYISHRLASTRFCDCIVFIQDGSIAECGTHEELMKQGGAYAHMFEVQSHYYKEAIKNTVETEAGL